MNGRLRVTHTFAVMEVPQSVYDLLRFKLRQAGYDHAILDERDGQVLDMHGIALAVQHTKTGA